MNVRGLQYSTDILESIEHICEYTQDLTFADLESDLKTQDAVLRRFGIIGEAAKQLSEVTREKYSDIPWKGIMGMRDILVHEYGGVRLETVWDTITNDLKSFEMSIREVLNDMS